jgi:hypothetical protein
LAHVKLVGMRPALFGPARARASTARNKPELARSTSRTVLGPGRQPVGQARHDPIRLRPTRHGSRPMWPIEHESNLAWPVRPDSSWPLTCADPMAQNPHAECIKSPASLLNPTSPAPALCSPSSHATLHHLHSPPRRTATPHRVALALHSLLCRTAANHCVTPALHHLHSHHAAPPLHRLHSPTGPIHHGQFWRIHQR